KSAGLPGLAVIQTSIPESDKAAFRAEPITPFPPTIRHFVDIRSLVTLASLLLPREPASSAYFSCSCVSHSHSPRVTELFARHAPDEAAECPERNTPVLPDRQHNRFHAVTVPL